MKNGYMMKNGKYNVCNIIYNVDYEHLKDFYNEDYYFQDEVDNLSNDVSDIIEKFLKSYFFRVSSLCIKESSEANQFLMWYNKDGKNKAESILKRIDANKINIDRIVKLFIHYDVLMEQAIEEKDLDCLLNVLMDTLVSIYDKIESWECFKSNDIELTCSVYDENEFIILNNEMSANTQAFFI